MLVTRLISSIALTGAMTFQVGLVYSQDYPNKPIRILTSKVGTGSDTVARFIAQGISAPLGQQVIVDNRANLIDIVMKSPPDGYNLMLDGASLWIEPLLRKTSYDMMTDFTPVTTVMKQVQLLAVPPSLPVKSAKELIALAKAKPGELNYAIGSVGSLAHLASEYLKSAAGINVVRVGYKSGSQADAELIAGQVQMAFGNAAGLMQFVKQGKLRGLAVSSREPFALAPGIPPLSDTVPGFEAIGVQGVFAAAKTPAAVTRKLSTEISRLMGAPDAKERLAALGVEPLTSTPEQLGARIKGEIAKWDKVIKDANIRID